MSGNPQDRCSQLIEDIEDTLAVVLTIRDDLGILRLPDGQALLRQRSYHTHSYCELERYRRPGYNKNCNDHCAKGIAKRCHLDSNPFVTCCWKGMSEVVVPIWRNGIHHITIFASGFRRADHKNAPGADASKTIQKEYEQLPIYDDKRARLLTRTLYNFGLGLLQEVDSAHQAQNPDSERKNQIRRFINNNAHHECKLANLAKFLFLSPSRCSQVVRDLFNTSFQDLLINERIERAKHLLSTTDLNQESIATQCGFNNHFYFSRLFKKVTGQTPGKFRKT